MKTEFSDETPAVTNLWVEFGASARFNTAHDVPVRWQYPAPPFTDWQQSAI